MRVLLESLALKYAVVLHQLEAASGRTVNTIHVVGGGSNNALLCQLTADASGLPVLAGPSEATALGNLGQFSYAVAPGAQDLVINRAFKLFPESSGSERETAEQRAFVRATRGVHW